MNTALIALELRKNRLTLLGLALGFVLVPPLSLLVAPRAGYGPAAAVQAGLLFWSLAGLPLAAAVLGASAGAALRGEADRAAEEGFPVSAASRVARALAGAVLQFVLLAAATVLISAVVSPSWRGSALGAGEAPAVWVKAAPWRFLLAGLSLDLLVSCFLGAYALGHALAGGLLGAALAAAEGAALALGLQYDFFYAERLASFAPFALAAGGAGLAAKLAAVPVLAERFERRRPVTAARLLAACALLGLGLALGVAAEENAYSRLRSSLSLVEPADGGLGPLRFGETEDGREADFLPAVYARGVPASTPAGGLVWIAGDGSVKRLIPDVPAGRLIGPGWGGWIEALHRDASGRLFVLRDQRELSGDRRELWAGLPETGLRRADLDLSGFSALVLERGRVVLKRDDWRSGRGRTACVLTERGGSVACVPPASAPPALPVSAAALAKDRRSVRVSARPGRVPSCRVPGRVPPDFTDPFPAVRVGGRPGWFVPFRDARGQGIVLCREDGSSRVAWTTGEGALWPLGGLGIRSLSDGSLVWPFGYDWNVVTPEGRFLPPISSRKLFAAWPRPAKAPLFTPLLVRRAYGRDWILFEGRRLVEIDESDGTPIQDWLLPLRDMDGGPWGAPVVLDGGLLVRRRGLSVPYFAAWDGSFRRLSAPPAAR